MRPLAPLLAVAVLGLATPAFAEPTSSSAPPAPNLEPWQLAPPPAPVMRRHSTGMMAGGIVLTVLGGTLAVAGSAIIAADVIRANAPGSDVGAIVAVWIGTPLLAGGTLLAAVGIPLLVVGARKELQPPDASRGLRPAVGIGPGSASLRWTF